MFDAVGVTFDAGSMSDALDGRLKSWTEALRELHAAEDGPKPAALVAGYAPEADVATLAEIDAETIVEAKVVPAEVENGQEE